MHTDLDLLTSGPPTDYIAPTVSPSPPCCFPSTPHSPHFLHCYPRLHPIPVHQLCLWEDNVCVLNIYEIYIFKQLFSVKSKSKPYTHSRLNNLLFCSACK